MTRHLITSAIPYINGIKHLGNLVGSQLPADLYARYLRARGHEVMFICATDEHGTPAELAEAFHVTRGAMTNTLSRLEWAGHIHIRPDWDDARRKFVAISPAGRAARDAALAAFMPRIADVVRDIGAERVRAALPASSSPRPRNSRPTLPWFRG